MTKYILHGGYSTKAVDRGRGFFEAMIEGFESPLVLECLFAREEADWQAAFDKDAEFARTNYPERDVHMKLARPETFLDQMKAADIVYFRGGRTSRLLEVLQQQHGFQELFGGKTIVGSSAGANMLSHFYWGLDDPGLRQGLGLVPAKALVHYRSDYNSPNVDWDQAEKELRAIAPELPLLTIPEGGFEIL